MELPLSRAQVSTLIYLPSVDSTNLELIRRLPDGLEEFTTVVSGEQTAGLGRLGRSWISEPGSSISMSVLLQPPRLELAQSLTLLVASSVHRALVKLTGSNQLSIKWPNDILLAGKKVCGILASLNQQSVIVGMGINLAKQQGAPEHATALSELGKFSFDQVVGEILAELKAAYQGYVSSGDFSAELAYLEKSCSTIGQLVRAELPDGSAITGQAVAISEAGHIVIQGDRRYELAAADVWHLRN